MTDPLFYLIKIAGFTLLITVLWALMLAIAYWDIQRRKQAGQRVNILAWMLVVALFPFAGFIGYLIARPFSRASTSRSRRLAERKRAGRQETKSSMEAEAGLPAPVHHLFSVTGGPDQGKQFRVAVFPAQIGRALNSAIRLEADDGVSRSHALIYQIDGALRIRDLQSAHGTWVNGKPIMDQVLEPGDQIDIGLSSLLYKHEER